ncbi:hypothetical protein V4Y04_28110 [Streptomyces sp. P9-A2]
MALQDSAPARHDHLLLAQHQELTDDSLKQIQDTVSPRAVIRFAQRHLTGHELEDGGWESGLASHTATQIRHFAERGHTRVAMAISDDHPPLSTVRLHFAQETARPLGLSPLRSLLLPASRRKAARALESLLSEDRGITAVAAFVDETALRPGAPGRDRSRPARAGRSGSDRLRRDAVRRVVDAGPDDGARRCRGPWTATPHAPSWGWEPAISRHRPRVLQGEST